MRIRRLKLANFRSVAEGKITFPGHTVIIGGNSVGKSTICEALDLLLGPERLSRRSPIDEHDFFERQYLDEDGVPIPIELEVVLTDLTDEVLARFRVHREYWDTATSELLDEAATPEDVDGDNVVPALRIRFEGVYDVEEDEFRAETYFSSPPADDETRRAKVTRAAKRQFGFIYLRALRTGARALSLERGSLLDIILKLKNDNRSAMWEQTLESMEDLDPAIHDIPQLREILEEIDARVRRFIGLSAEDRAFRLYPSALTRESLRRSITLFGSSERSNTPVPYWRLGSGVVNSMVFSLLTFIAELKSNVIFAMEEPEIAIPPHTQRRIVQFLRTRMDQSILTTHSPFVLEQYDPTDVVLLERENDGAATGRPIEVVGIKAKAYKGNLRRVLAEAMRGNGEARDNPALHAARESLHGMAERGRNLTGQIDLAAKLAGRVIDTAVKELEARDSNRWPNAEIGKSRRSLESARGSAVEALRRARHFVHQADWLQERFPDARLRDVEGLVKLVERGEVEAHDWNLTPGRYVGVAPEEEDEDFDFEKALRSIHLDLKGLNEEADKLAARIVRNFEELRV